MKFKKIILAILLIFLLGWLYYVKMVNRSSVVVDVQLNHLKSALEMFKSDCGSYPTTEQGLFALIKKPQELNCPRYDSKKYMGGEMDSVPRDPNDCKFVYISDGKSFDLRSESCSH